MTFMFKSKRGNALKTRENNEESTETDIESSWQPARTASVVAVKDTVGAFKLEPKRSRQQRSSLFLSPSLMSRPSVAQLGKGRRSSTNQLRAGPSGIVAFEPSVITEFKKLRYLTNRDLMRRPSTMMHSKDVGMKTGFYDKHCVFLSVTGITIKLSLGQRRTVEPGTGSRLKWSLRRSRDRIPRYASRSSYFSLRMMDASRSSTTFLSSKSSFRYGVASYMEDDTSMDDETSLDPPKSTFKNRKSLEIEAKRLDSHFSVSSHSMEDLGQAETDQKLSFVWDEMGFRLEPLSLPAAAPHSLYEILMKGQVEPEDNAPLVSDKKFKDSSRAEEGKNKGKLLSSSSSVTTGAKKQDKGSKQSTKIITKSETPEGSISPEKSSKSSDTEMSFLRKIFKKAPKIKQKIKVSNETVTDVDKSASKEKYALPTSSSDETIRAAKGLYRENRQRPPPIYKEPQTTRQSIQHNGSKPKAQIDLSKKSISRSHQRLPSLDSVDVYVELDSPSFVSPAPETTPEELNVALQTASLGESPVLNPTTHDKSSEYDKKNPASISIKVSRAAKESPRSREPPSPDQDRFYDVFHTSVSPAETNDGTPHNDLALDQVISQMDDDFSRISSFDASGSVKSNSTGNRSSKSTDSKQKRLTTVGMNHTYLERPETYEITSKTPDDSSDNTNVYKTDSSISKSPEVDVGRSKVHGNSFRLVDTKKTKNIGKGADDLYSKSLSTHTSSNEQTKSGVQGFDSDARKSPDKVTDDECDELSDDPVAETSKAQIKTFTLDDLMSSPSVILQEGSHSSPPETDANGGSDIRPFTVDASQVRPERPADNGAASRPKAQTKASQKRESETESDNEWESQTEYFDCLPYDESARSRESSTRQGERSNGLAASLKRAFGWIFTQEAERLDEKEEDFYSARNSSSTDPGGENSR